MFSAWQEVVQQDQGPGQGPEEAQGAVHYKETSPSPLMDSEYSSSSSSHCSILPALSMSSSAFYWQSKIFM